MFFTSNILFSFFHILLSQLHSFVCSLSIFFFTGHIVCSIFSTSFTYRRSGTFFFVVAKSLPVVTSERVWCVYFNFDYCVSYIYFGNGFGGVKTKNIYIFVRIVWLFFSLEIFWASITLCLQRFVFYLI